MTKVIDTSATIVYAHSTTIDTKCTEISKVDLTDEGDQSGLKVVAVGGSTIMFTTLLFKPIARSWRDFRGRSMA